jgi:hypothetical protein
MPRARILGLILAFALAVTTAGCTSTAPSPPPGPATGDAEPVPTAAVPQPPPQIAIEKPADSAAIDSLVIQKFADLSDGSKRLNALLALYPLMGMPVLSPDDNPLVTGYSGEGLAIAWWEVWRQAESPRSGGVTLADLTDSLVDSVTYPETVPDASRPAIRMAVLHDLQNAANSADARVRTFGAFMSQTSPSSHSQLQSAADPVTVSLDADQAVVLSRIVAADASFMAVHAATSAVPPPSGTSVVSKRAGMSQPCNFTQTEQQIIKIVEEVISRAIAGQQVIPVPWGWGPTEGGLKGRLPALNDALEKELPPALRGGLRITPGAVGRVRAASCGQEEDRETYLPMHPRCPDRAGHAGIPLPIRWTCGRTDKINRGYTGFVEDLSEQVEVPVSAGAALQRLAAELGVSHRQVYVLLGRYRQGSGLVTDLAVGRSSTGRHRILADQGAMKKVTGRGEHFVTCSWSGSWPVAPERRILVGRGPVQRGDAFDPTKIGGPHVVRSSAKSQASASAK